MTALPAPSSGTAPPRAARILVAEDDDDVGRFLEITLGVDGYEIHRVEDGPSAVAQAVAIVPDLVLLDVSMPGLDGVSVCHELRRDPRTSALPIIMLTARVQQHEKVLGLEAGADDYITKPFDPPELVARIEAALRRTRQLRDVSPLTGLPGNIAIFRYLDGLLAQDAQDDGFALLHADLDNFKAFNDRYGFAAGDEVIKATATVLIRLLEAMATSPSFAGHVGGDDFVLVTSGQTAEPYAEAVVRDFDAMIPAFYDDRDRARGAIEVVSRAGDLRRYPLMTVSLGIVLSSPHRFSAPAEMASVAAEMKNLAKRMPASGWCVNRRSR